MTTIFESDSDLAIFLDILTDLSLNEENFEVASAALNLQIEMEKLYQN